MSLVCCDAGKAAHPEPCPWHPGDHGPDPKVQAAQNDPTRMGAVGGTGGQAGGATGLTFPVGRSGWPIGSRRTQLPQGMGSVQVGSDGVGGQGGTSSATMGHMTNTARLTSPQRMSDLTRIAIALCAVHGRAVDDGYVEVRITKHVLERFANAAGAHITVADDGRGGFILAYGNDAMKEVADGQQQRRQVGVRLPEPSLGVPEHQREQDEASPDSERGEDLRGSEPDGEEGSPDTEATRALTCHANCSEGHTYGWGCALSSSKADHPSTDIRHAPVRVPNHAFVSAFGDEASGCGHLADQSTTRLCGRPKHEHADDWPDHTRAMKVPGAESR